MAIVEQLGDDSWLEYLAAIWHWCFANMHKYYCFCPFIFFFFLFFFLPVSINRTEWSTMPARPKLKCYLNNKKYWRKKYIQNLCLMFVYVWFVLCLYLDWFCKFDLTWFTYRRTVFKCIFAYDRVWSSWDGPVQLTERLSPLPTPGSPCAVDWSLKCNN